MARSHVCYTLREVVCREVEAQRHRTARKSSEAVKDTGKKDPLGDQSHYDSHGRLPNRVAPIL
ncbi:hypothetical protein F441_04884 [Phytophthora nicotianae CJ01A1]|uniref:Uncharacterized protein n=3 Tax=Phytophthora nicotianae TaxID=4792 RepID=V9FLE8_PHYNI|nr:hypothetical protein F443_04887 [Phytophthora nicotianae P1569]ETP21658.1 hypothetical protein F441_04884 [Phytophthora nicotianae CJ01A1]ETP49550.1 hypothetical protein F442_04954 [Phytophthora nicotianae P10297]